LDEVATVSPRESNVRISIVVPHLGDVVAFEETLVSVLENRPMGAEIWVAHDGTYQDPFDLGDEVRFITAASADLPTLIAAAAEVASGRYIHVIGNGIRATHDWTQAAVECLGEDRVAMVAPVVRQSPEGVIVAAGWCDSKLDVVSPLGCGSKQVSGRQAVQVRGAYLLASFWRKPALQSACRALVCSDAVAAEFAWARLLVESGWRCQVASDSVLIGAPGSLLDSPGFHRGHSLRSLWAEIDDQSIVGSVALAALVNMLNPIRAFSPSRWADTLGQAASLIRETACVGAIRYDQIRSPEDGVATLPMTMPVARTSGYQRAA